MKTSTFCLLKAVSEWASTALFALWIIYRTVNARNPLPALIDLSDRSLMQPFIDEERIPLSTLYLVTTFYPAIVLLATIAIYRDFKNSSTWWDIHFILLGHVSCVFLAASFSIDLKTVMGRPRPDFLARCTLSKPFLPSSRFLSSTQCMNQDFVNEGLRSFPAEHSAIPTAALVYLTFMIPHLRNLFKGSIRLASDLEKDSQMEEKPSLLRWRIFDGASIVFHLSLAGYCAHTKVMENRHHPIDVVAGAFLGSAIGYGVYRLYKWHNGPLSLEWYRTHRWDGLRKIRSE